MAVVELKQLISKKSEEGGGGLRQGKKKVDRGGMLLTERGLKNLFEITQAMGR